MAIAEQMLTQHQPAFDALTHILIDANQRMNLTRIVEPAQIRSRHYLDSLAALAVLDACEPATAVDIGSGAGFPSLPLAIVRPNWKFTSVEATGKKVDFQRHAAWQMALANFKAVQGRAEELSCDKHHRETYHLCLARAVAHLNVLVELGLGLVRPGGKMIVWKGPDWPTELAAAQKTIATLGGQVNRVAQYTLPQTDGGFALIEIDKVKPMPSSYPRPYGIIVKR